MKQLYTHIQYHLDNANKPDSLRDLFCQILHWDTLIGDGQQIAGDESSHEDEEVIAYPIANMASIPVFWVDWQDDTLPTIAQRRAMQQNLSQVALQHILCYVTLDGKKTAFVWAHDRGCSQIELRTLTYEVGFPGYTMIERLAMLDFSPSDGNSGDRTSDTIIIERINQAFDAEAVTHQFYTAYRQQFEHAEQHITGMSGEERWLFTQTLLTRLMFLLFLERKGWLTFHQRNDYLKALWDDHQQTQAKDPAANFYRDRLKPLFAMGIGSNGLPDTIEEHIGNFPYLNGAIFATETDDNPDIVVPDEALEPLLTNLFSSFNFTVSESTPFDIEVAVDPEMLGKIFEELVTGRHESGSYYTPRPVVAFMCREGLKGYLATQSPKETPAAIARFVDERETADLHDPAAILHALTTVRVCDPACGSGAYVVGMLHELTALRSTLCAEHGIDDITPYQRKRAIIQHNLYGVDIDSFAVYIAHLRLWLSLVVEYDGDTPPPLPNLEYTFVTGDTIISPDPSHSAALTSHNAVITQLSQMKEDYFDSHHSDKQTLHKQIEAHKQQLAKSVHNGEMVQGFDWQGTFAEVFVNGGFDIVVANPPYVRQELIKQIKPILKDVYADIYAGSGDLYIYFYARVLQILRNHGMMAVISSNKWFRASYGKGLQTYLTAQTSIHSITDFGELPLFIGTKSYPVIFVAQKGGKQSKSILFTTVKTLDPPYPDVLKVVQQQGQPLSPQSLQGKTWHLDTEPRVNLLKKLHRGCTPLIEYVSGRMYYGIKTGLNEVFVVDRTTRDLLIDKHPSSEEILKPYIRGRDVKRWHVYDPDLWLIFTRHGIDIEQYPAILEYLTRYKKRLTPGTTGGRKAGKYAWYELQDTIAYWKEFEHKQIVWGNLATQPEFAFAASGTHVNAPACTIISGSVYLLGILNSRISKYFVAQHAAERQGGFLEYKLMYVSLIPIPPTPPVVERKAIEKLVMRCIYAKGQGSKVAAWEAEIDARLARLYGLTKKEMKMIREE